MSPGGVSGARLILRKLREIMAAGGGAQDRLDRLVKMIAVTMVADVCSIYLKRGEHQELFATEGLKADAVHRTRMKPGEGLVGLVVENASPLNISGAPSHPRFSYRPETGEDPFLSFLGVPILRADRVFGVLVVQNRVAKTYGDDEVEALQTIAMVLAEMVAAGDFGDLSQLSDLEVRLSRPETVQGRSFSEGLAIGQAVLYEPHTPLERLFSDDPITEEARLEAALAQVRANFDAIADGEAQRLVGGSREVVETFRMLAWDRSWEAKLKDSIRTGFSAEAAVERVRQEHRAKLSSARDPYLRERLHDLEDLDLRLLRALSPGGGAPEALPDNAILVARDLAPAELFAYGPGKLAGIALEDGAPTSHAAIVARALGVPMVGRAAHLLSRVEAGDPIIIDGEKGEIALRPSAEVRAAYDERIAIRSETARELAKLRDLPAETKDGGRITLLINAGLILDVQNAAEVGAEGVGLFRTEFQFMLADSMPRLNRQIALYREAMEAADPRPVTFRTLDLGGDKVLPYMTAEPEENPALGWRALRIGLDRPALMRYQLRALLAAGAGRHLRIMFPLVTTIGEMDAARALVEQELARVQRMDSQAPAKLEIGAMLETPALAFAVDQLAGRADFLSIGTNDLMQYFFAADRGNPRTAERYDMLSPPALRFLAQICESAVAAKLPCSVCGEAAGRPLEALALVALGFTRLSMPASGLPAVKRMIRSIELSAVQKKLRELLKLEKNSIRPELYAFAVAHGAQL